MRKTLSVPAIENGTVIDHITSGQTLRILSMLELVNKQYKMTVGFHLPSKRMCYKDLIKIENLELTNKEANEITVFAPEATINIIKNFAVVQKIISNLPPSISGIFICPNLNCITHGEWITSHFSLEESGKQVFLTCKYCEKTYERNRVKAVT